MPKKFVWLQEVHLGCRVPITLVVYVEYVSFRADTDSRRGAESHRIMLKLSTWAHPIGPASKSAQAARITDHDASRGQTLDLPANDNRLLGWLYQKIGRRQVSFSRHRDRGIQFVTNEKHSGLGTFIALVIDNSAFLSAVLDREPEITIPDRFNWCLSPINNYANLVFGHL